jgi:hypothetical protein
MHFTPKNSLVFCGILIAAMTAPVTRLPASPMAAGQVTPAVVQSFQANAQAAPALQMAGNAYYQPVSSSYKNKHWWKRNAPIIGGAGGGALIGGLAGGGTGALVGGAIGGGGGYLYKRSRDHHHHHYNNDYRH